MAAAAPRRSRERLRHAACAGRSARRSRASCARARRSAASGCSTWSRSRSSRRSWRAWARRRWPRARRCCSCCRCRSCRRWRSRSRPARSSDATSARAILEAAQRSYRVGAAAGARRRPRSWRCCSSRSRSRCSRSSAAIRDVLALARPLLALGAFFQVVDAIGHRRGGRAARRGRHALAVRGPGDAGLGCCALPVVYVCARSCSTAACSARGRASSCTCGALGLAFVLRFQRRPLEDDAHLSRAGDACLSWSAFATARRTAWAAPIAGRPTAPSSRCRSSPSSVAIGMNGSSFLPSRLMPVFTRRMKSASV